MIYTCLQKLPIICKNKMQGAIHLVNIIENSLQKIQKVLAFAGFLF